MVLLLQSEDSPLVYFHCSEIVASHTVPSFKILILQVCSLSQTLLIAFINSLLRHYKWNYCLKLLIQEGCSLTFLPISGFVLYVL